MIYILSVISVKIDGTKGLNINVGRNAKRVSRVKDGLSSLRHSIDPEIGARRSIDSRMRNVHGKASAIESKLYRLEAFINYSMNNYSDREDYLVSDVNARFKKQLKYDINSGYFCINEFGEAARTTFLDELKVGAGAVRCSIKNTYSKVKEALSPGGSLYKPYLIGKAVLGIGIGVATVIGSGIGTLFSGGTATPIMLVTATYGVNDILNNSFDLYNAIKDNYDKVDQVNVLKRGLGGVFGLIGGALGSEKTGRLVGEGIYYVGNVAAIAKGGYDAIKDVKGLKGLNKAGLSDEVKNLNKSISKSYKYVGKDISKIKGVKQLKKVVSIDTINDLGRARSVSDISKVSAVGTLKQIEYGKTIKKVWKVAAVKPLEKLARNNKNIITGCKGISGIKGVVIDLPKDAIELINDAKVDYNANIAK